MIISYFCSILETEDTPTHARIAPKHTKPQATKTDMHKHTVLQYTFAKYATPPSHDQKSLQSIHKSYIMRIHNYTPASNAETPTYDHAIFASTSSNTIH